MIQNLSIQVYTWRGKSPRCTLRCKISVIPLEWKRRANLYPVKLWPTMSQRLLPLSSKQANKHSSFQWKITLMSLLAHVQKEIKDGTISSCKAAFHYQTINMILSGKWKSIPCLGVSPHRLESYSVYHFLSLGKKVTLICMFVSLCLRVQNLLKNKLSQLNEMPIVSLSWESKALKPMIKMKLIEFSVCFKKSIAINTLLNRHKIILMVKCKH